jgi:hypothetical protein
MIRRQAREGSRRPIGTIGRRWPGFDGFKLHGGGAGHRAGNATLSGVPGLKVGPMVLRMRIALASALVLVVVTACGSTSSSPRPNVSSQSRSDASSPSKTGPSSPPASSASTPSSTNPDVVRQARAQLRAALSRAPKVSSFSLYQYRRQAIGGTSEIQVDRGTYDLRARGYEDTVSTRGKRVTALSLGNDLYVNGRGANWVKIVTPRSLYRSGAYVTQPGAALMTKIVAGASVREVDPRQFVVTETYDDYLHALGTESALATQALSSMKGFDGTVTTQIVLAQNGLPSVVIDTVHLHGPKAGAAITTQSFYSGYGARVHLSAPRGLAVSRVVHVASLPGLDAAISCVGC